MTRKRTKAQANNRRRARRVWNNLVAKLSSYPNLFSQTPVMERESLPSAVDDAADVMSGYSPEDAWDRHERHMKPIRQAQQRVVKLSDEHIRQQIEGGG
tara:strand:+ start:267 stop:563 length:297 start_codon:yes stop_codon:yes gene_type:complete